MPILRRSVVQFCSAPLVRFHTALDNQIPVVTKPQENQIISARLGEKWTYPIIANDPEGKPLSYLAETWPRGLAVDPATGVTTWTPTNELFVGKNVKVVISVGDRPIGGIEDRPLRAVYRIFFVHVMAPIATSTPTPTATVTPSPQSSGAALGPALDLTPTPTPFSTSQVLGVIVGQQDEIAADPQELQQLIQDIEAEIERLRKELKAQQKYQVLGVGGLARSVYPYQGIPDFQGNLWFGMTHPDVRNLQKALNADPDTIVAKTGAGSEVPSKSV